MNYFHVSDERTKGFTGNIFDSSKFRSYYSLSYTGNKEDIESFKIRYQDFFRLIIPMVKTYTNLLENVDEKHYPFLEQLIFNISLSSSGNGHEVSYMNHQNKRKTITSHFFSFSF